MAGFPEAAERLRRQEAINKALERRILRMDHEIRRMHKEAMRQRRRADEADRKGGDCQALLERAHAEIHELSTALQAMQVEKSAKN